MPAFPYRKVSKHDKELFEIKLIFKKSQSLQNSNFFSPSKLLSPPLNPEKFFEYMLSCFSSKCHCYWISAAAKW